MTNEVANINEQVETLSKRIVLIYRSNALTDRDRKETVMKLLRERLALTAQLEVARGRAR